MKGKVSKARIFVAVIIIEIVAVLGIAAFSGYTIFKNIRTTDKIGIEVKQKLELVQTISSLQKEISDTTSSISNERKVFFDDDTLMRFLKDIYNTAKQKGVVIEEVKFGMLGTAASLNPPVKTLPISLSVSGSYKNLQNFLYFLESFSKTISISRLSFSSSGVSSQIECVFGVITNSPEQWIYKGE